VTPCSLVNGYHRVDKTFCFALILCPVKGDRKFPRNTDTHLQHHTASRPVRPLYWYGPQNPQFSFNVQNCSKHSLFACHLYEKPYNDYSDWLRPGRSGIESRWGRDFPPVQTGPGAHPASCKMGTWSFPRVKCSRGVLLTTHPLLVPRSW